MVGLVKCSGNNANKKKNASNIHLDEMEFMKMGNKRIFKLHYL